MAGIHTQNASHFTKTELRGDYENTVLDWDWDFFSTAFGWMPDSVGGMFWHKSNEDRKIAEGQEMIAELTNMPVALQQFFLA